MIWGENQKEKEVLSGDNMDNMNFFPLILQYCTFDVT